MLAPQRHDEKMQRRLFPQERHAAAQSQCQELQLRALFLPSDKQLFKGSFVQSIAGGNRQRNDAVELFLAQEQQIADQIGDEEPVHSQPLEPKGKEPKFALGKGWGRLEDGHLRACQRTGAFLLRCERAES